MTRLTLEEGRPRPEFELLDEGSIHDARIASYKTLPARWEDPDGTRPELIQVNFALLDDRHQGRIVRGETRLEFHADPSCQLYQWVCAVLGVRELPVGFDLDLDRELINKACRVVVTVEDFDSKKKFNEDGTPERVYINKVGEVLPSKASAVPVVNVAARPAGSTV